MSECLPLWCHVFVLMLVPSSCCWLRQTQLSVTSVFHHSRSDPVLLYRPSSLPAVSLHTEAAQWSQANRHGQTCDGVQFPTLSNTEINKPGPRPEEGWSEQGGGKILYLFETERREAAVVMDRLTTVFHVSWGSKSFYRQCNGTSFVSIWSSLRFVDLVDIVLMYSRWLLIVTDITNNRKGNCSWLDCR